MTTPAEPVAYVNGAFLPQSRAVEMMQAMSLGAAGGFYDAERTFGGRVFKLRQHLERMFNGLRYSGMDPGVTIDDVEKSTLELLERNLPLLELGADFSVTQIVSPAPAGSPGDPPAFNVVIHCRQLDFSEFARGYVAGVRIVTPATYRAASGSAQRTYPLMTDAEGSITECTGANFMFVSGGRIKLPDRRNVLPGVSMATVLELAAGLGVPVDEGDYAAADVYTADEAFVTSTRICMQPVAAMNGLGLPAPVPGPLTARLQRRWSEAVGLDFIRQALDQVSWEE